MDHSRLQILLIEDEHSFAKMLERKLSRGFDLPHGVTHSTQLDDAVQLLRSGDFDLIVLDLSLPDSSGLETFERVHEAASDVPIVILSGQEMTELAVQAVRCGAQDVLSKERNDDLQLLRSLKFAIERKRRLRAEGELAAGSMIQKSLLPAQNPSLPGYEIAAAMTPAAETAGDYYGFPTLGDESDADTVCVTVADVSGHGLGPAMVMAGVSGALQALAERESDPALVLEGLHGIISRSRHSHFLTMFIGNLNVTRHTLTWASAGHPGWHLPAAGPASVLAATRTPLGLPIPQLPSSGQCGRLKMEVGDVLFLPTDGVYEAFDGNQHVFGVKRMLSTVNRLRTNPASEVISMLFDEVMAHSQATSPADDLTAVMIRRYEE